MEEKIRLGYELGTAEEVDISLSHLVVTGLTQQSGKTTTLHALLKRSNKTAILIKTKPGEQDIYGDPIQPYFAQRFDWEYASDLLEASRKEKLKFERSWIIQYSKGAKDIFGFQKNINDALEDHDSGAKRLKDLTRSVLVTLQAYLDKIVPELSSAKLSNFLMLNKGLNVMDLENLSEETQGLIIGSVLGKVLTSHKDVIVVVPEAWKYLPERHATPVKRPAENFIRQGAANGNYLWIDSQDITGVSKVILKQVSTWIMGYQREINEIKRTLDQLPVSKAQKPKPEDIATLKVGQFYVSTSKFTKKVYVQPYWLLSMTAKGVAAGEIEYDDIVHTYKPTPKIYSPPTPTPKVKLSTSTHTGKPVPEKTTGWQQDLENLRAELMQKIQSMLSTVGVAVYEVAPLEKIKKDFLQEAKDHILSTVSELDDHHKKMLKWIEQNGKNTKKTELFLNCFGKSATGGNTYTNLGKKVLTMKNLELIRVDTQQRIFPNLKKRVEDRISQYGATEQEIDQVYNHILMEVAGSDNKP